MPRKNPEGRNSQAIHLSSSREAPPYLSKCIEFLKHFARISGLQCNLEKAAVIPIGGNYDINDEICPELALSWENKFTLMGFQIDNRLKHLNEKCFKKVHEISRRWVGQDTEIECDLAQP